MTLASFQQHLLELLKSILGWRKPVVYTFRQSWLVKSIGKKTVVKLWQAVSPERHAKDLLRQDLEFEFKTVHSVRFLECSQIIVTFKYDQTSVQLYKYLMLFVGKKWVIQLSWLSKCHPKSKVEQLCFGHKSGQTSLSILSAQVLYSKVDSWSYLQTLV